MANPWGTGGSNGGGSDADRAWPSERSANDRPTSENFDGDGVAYLRSLKQSASPPAAVTETAADPATPAQVDRRRHIRYPCEGSLELQLEDGSGRTWATFTDLSEQGCYAEMMNTYPQGTKFKLSLDLFGLRITSAAIVRVNYPFLGMGIEFTAMEQADRDRLEEMVRLLDNNSGASAATAAGTAPADLNRLRLPPMDDPAAAIHALAGFLSNHDAIQRADFVRIVRQTQADSSSE